MYLRHLALAFSLILTFFGLNCASKGELVSFQLLKASQVNDLASAQKLLKIGINPNICTANGITPLMWASYYGHTPLARLLLGYKAEINLATKVNQEFNFGKFLSNKNHGTTALMLAAYAGRTDLVIILLKSGAQVNAKDSDGQTALIYAILGHKDWPHKPLDDNRKKLIQILLEFGADSHAVDAHGLDAAYYYKCVAGLVPGFDQKYDYDQHVLEADALYQQMR